MRKIAALLSLLLSIPFAQGSAVATSDPGADSVTSSLSEMSQILDQRQAYFQQFCRDPGGNFVDRQVLSGDTLVIDCGIEKHELLGAIRKLDAQAQKLKGRIQELADCATAPGTPLGDMGSSLDGHLRAIKSKALGCDKVRAPGQCAKDIACNVERSIVNTGLGALAFSPSLARSIEAGMSDASKSCGSPLKADCLSTAVLSLLKMLWTSVEGLWDGTKWVANKTGEWVVSAWKYYTGQEDQTSNAAIAASTQSDSALARFKKNPGKFIEGMISDFVSMINEAIKNNYACERWEGVPQFSKCLKPLVAWECASCDQILNAGCGVVGYVAGYAAGPILTSYMVSGTAGASRIILNTIRAGKDVLEARVYASIGADANAAVEGAFDALKTKGGAFVEKLLSTDPGAGAEMTFIDKTVQKFIDLKNWLQNLPENTATALGEAGHTTLAAAVRIPPKVASDYIDLITRASDAGLEHFSGWGEDLPAALKLRGADWLDSLAANGEREAGEAKAAQATAQSANDARRARELASKADRALARAGKLRAQADRLRDATGKRRVPDLRIVVSQLNHRETEKKEESRLNAVPEEMLARKTIQASAARILGHPPTQDQVKALYEAHTSSRMITKIRIMKGTDAQGKRLFTDEEIKLLGNAGVFGESETAKLAAESVQIPQSARKNTADVIKRLKELSKGEQATITLKDAEPYKIQGTIQATDNGALYIRAADGKLYRVPYESVNESFTDFITATRAYDLVSKMDETDLMIAPTRGGLPTVGFPTIKQDWGVSVYREGAGHTNYKLGDIDWDKATVVKPKDRVRFKIGGTIRDGSYLGDGEFQSSDGGTFLLKDLEAGSLEKM